MTGYFATPPILRRGRRRARSRSEILLRNAVDAWAGPFTLGTIFLAALAALLFGGGNGRATDAAHPAPSATPTTAPSTPSTPSTTPTTPAPPTPAPKGLATASIWQPVEVAEGTAFTLDDGSRVEEGWDVRRSDGLFDVTGHIINTGTKPLRPAITIVFAIAASSDANGTETEGEIVGQVRCFADLTPAGASRVLRCSSADAYAQYDTITAETMI